jgi:hypothetical protein
MVFLTLLQKTRWVEMWVPFVASIHGVNSVNDWPYFHWDQESTAQLLESLEFGDQEEGAKDVVKQVYDQGLTSQLANPSQDSLMASRLPNIEQLQTPPSSESLIPTSRTNHLPRRNPICSDNIQQKSPILRFPTKTEDLIPPPYLHGSSTVASLNDAIQMQPYHYRPGLHTTPPTPGQDPRFRPRSTHILRKHSKPSKLKYRVGLVSESTGVPLQLTRPSSGLVDHQTYSASQGAPPVILHDSLPDKIKSALLLRKEKRVKSDGSSFDLEQA